MLLFVLIVFISELAVSRLISTDDSVCVLSDKLELDWQCSSVPVRLFREKLLVFDGRY